MRTTGGGRAGPRPLRRIVTRAVLLCGVLLLASVLAVTGFILTRCYASAPPAASAAPPPSGVDAYHRSEAFTFLTLPEWFIVFSADEYAAFVKRRSPAQFPFVRSAAQYWSYYGAVCDATRGAYPFETGYHVMLGVIGLSQTAEYAIKGAYEGSVGRVTEWLFTSDTAEDRFAAAVAAEYGAFMHETPWYRFPFFARLRQLWTEVPGWGPHVLRKWERRAALTGELAFKGVYGWMMGRGSQAAYGAEELTTYARVTDVTPEAIAAAGGRPLDGHPDVIALPRYERFTPAATALVHAGGRLLDVAGNHTMLATVLVPAGRTDLGLPATVRIVTRGTMASDSGRVRVALAFSVADLGPLLRQLARKGATLEHLYDY